MLRGLKALMAPLVPQALRDARAHWLQARFARLSREAAFSEVYAKNLWGGEPGEFCSGSGSSSQLREAYTVALCEWFRSEGIRSIVDIGCGDFRVGGQLVSPALDYVGVDIVAPLIRRNTERFGAENVRFMQLDVATTRPPEANVALIRQVLQHLSNAEIFRVLDNCSHYPRLVVTEHVCSGSGVVPNLDKPHGPFTRVTSNSGVFLDQPPFSLPCRVLLEVAVGPGEVLRTVIVERSDSGPDR